MIKKFFEALWIGVEETFKEYEGLVFLVIIISISSAIGLGILRIFEKNPSEETIFGIVICSVLVGIFVSAAIIHAIDTVRYSNEHNVSIKEGWEATNVDLYDDDE